MHNIYNTYYLMILAGRSFFRHFLLQGDNCLPVALMGCHNVFQGRLQVALATNITQTFPTVVTIKKLALRNIM